LEYIMQSSIPENVPEYSRLISNPFSNNNQNTVDMSRTL
jgi:hypothetical protein